MDNNEICVDPIEKESKSIFRAILISFLGLLIFYLVSGVVAALLAVIGYLLYQIPLLRFLFKSWIGGLFSQDSMFAPICGYLVTLAIFRKLSKGKGTADLACVLLGAYLLIISAICLILNLIYGNSVWINIACGISGIVFIVRKSADMV